MAIKTRKYRNIDIQYHDPWPENIELLDEYEIKLMETNDEGERYVISRAKYRRVPLEHSDSRK